LELLDKNVEDVVYELINRSISFGFVKADDNRKLFLSAVLLMINGTNSNEKRKR